MILTIGKTEKEIKKKLENLSEDQLKINSKISFHEYEVILTKKELKFLIAEIENYEKEGPELDESTCLTKCESCEIETDIEIMSQDDASNWFCPDCWKELAPVMKAEYDELKAKGEID